MLDINIKLDDDFFKEEERSGYLVTKKMKEVWAVEMDLFNKLMEVCDKYGLRCFADAGTMIGAVRHKGFIPWDDDIDVTMFRDDYDKLVSVAEREFKEPYFFQCAYTDKDYKICHGQLRNSNTTAYLRPQWNNKVQYNCGIFIDIFVLDNVDDDPKRVEKQKRKYNFYKNLMIILVKNDPAKMKLWERLVKLCLKSFRVDKTDIFRKLENVLRASGDENRMVAPLSFIFETEKRIRDRHIYDDIIMMDFENMKIPVPKGYHEFLTKRYGDYMKPEQVPTTHGGAFFDPNNSYKMYMPDMGKMSWEERIGSNQ